MTASSVTTERASPAIWCAMPSAALALIGACTVWAFVRFARWHLSNIGIWFDEAVQFWMSRGADPYGPPFTKPGGLIDTVHYNGVDNLDPGGFTILLRWWLHGGTGPVWQRTLPLIFFVIGVAALALIGWRRFRSLPFALLCALLTVPYSLLLYFATELRAYSMEFAGIAVGCALIDRIALKPANERLLLVAGTTFGFFLTSRYAFALFTAAAAFALIVSCHLRRREDAPTTRLADLPAMAVPVMAVALIVARYALWPQFRARIAYHDGAMLQYFASTTAAGKSPTEILSALAHNLLGFAGLPITVAALAGLLVLLQSAGPGVQSGPIRARLHGLANLVEGADLTPICLTCLVALILSALTWRWHPWDMSAKWSLWLHGLSAVVVVQFAAAALAGGLDVKLLSRVLPARWPATAVTGVALLLAAAVMDVRLATYHRPMWPSLVGELTALESLKPEAGTVAIDLYDYPTLRYLYEYGAVPVGMIYPSAFRSSYENYNEATRSLIASDTRFLVSGRKAEDAIKFFAPTRILLDPELPPHLYRVEPARAQ
jgi:hypothetical protein